MVAEVANANIAFFMFKPFQMFADFNRRVRRLFRPERGGGRAAVKFNVDERRALACDAAARRRALEVRNQIIKALLTQYR